MSTVDLGIHELEAATGVPMRTLRHWVKKGVLPGPRGRGRVARYTESHLIRAQAIKHLRASKVSIREIRQRICALSDEEVKALVPPTTRATAVVADGMPAVPPPTTYPFAMWELIGLAEGLFIMLDPRKGPALRRIVDEIYKHYSLVGRNTT
jgi:DNA-binding transcriptional MerR regulator